jgi:SAM-dependent methyltransferase
MELFPLYSENYWIYFLFALLAFIILWFLYKKYLPNETTEGFYQKKPFLLKEGPASYDTFYTEIYEDLYKPRFFSVLDIDILCKNTKCNQNNIILDIGCGTGHNIAVLKDKGYTKVFGIDNALEMVQYTKNNNPYLIQYGDVTEDPMLYENNTFSHILCTRFTIYEIKKKDILLKHCYFWLSPGGVLLLHLVDPEKYDMSVPKSKIDSAIPEQLERITKTIIDFPGFTFTNDYEIKETVIQRETFIDKKTEHVRQNERILYMDTKEHILEIATQIGFQQLLLTTPYSDKHQFLVILLKPLCGDN